MAEDTLGDLIDNRISYLINQQPAPKKVTIVKIYGDNHVDIHINDDGGILTYVETIGAPVLNKTGILIFFNNNIKEYIVIC